MSQASRKLAAINSVAALMYELTAAWDARLEAAVERVRDEVGADLTIRQALVLWQLHEPLAMGELAARLGCDQSNATGLVDRLQRRGYVRRVADRRDRRSRRVKLTEPGEAFRARLDGALRTASPLEALDVADLETLQALLERLREVTYLDATGP